MDIKVILNYYAISKYSHSSNIASRSKMKLTPRWRRPRVLFNTYF